MCKKTVVYCQRSSLKSSTTVLSVDSVWSHPLPYKVSTSDDSFTKISPPTRFQVSTVCIHQAVDICWSSNRLQGSQIGQTCHSRARSFSGGVHLVLLLRLSTVCRKDRWAWSSSRVEQSSSSSSMMPHCTQRRRGSRCPALQTQAVARDWGNSSITKGSRWAGSVSMLVAMVNSGPNVRRMSCRQWSSGVDVAYDVGFKAFRSKLWCIWPALSST